MDEMISLLERLRPVIERMGGRGNDADDLFGDVALACIEKWDQYDWSHPEIEGRIVRIAKNLKIKRLRRERLRKHACLQSEDCGVLVSNDRTVEETKPRVSVRCQEAVDCLPDRYRQVIREHFISGKRLIAIARVLKLPSATIRTRCRRALQQLAQDPRIRELAAEVGLKL